VLPHAGVNRPPVTYTGEPTGRGLYMAEHGSREREKERKRGEKEMPGYKCRNAP